MNNLVSDLMGFDGRINRQRWWIGIIVIIIIGIIIYWILGLIFGTGMMMDAKTLTDPAAMTAYLQKAGWVGLIVGVVLAYPNLSLTVKRRHDRNNNGYDAMALIGLSVLWNLLTALGVVTNLGVVSTIVGLILLVLSLWILVQAGFLKGTAGPNQYGPDPLGG
jgi:uncharacterized membrane protein YhaH (DUF805 family)